LYVSFLDKRLAGCQPKTTSTATRFIAATQKAASQIIYSGAAFADKKSLGLYRECDGGVKQGVD
jgi:hypothetical protein